MTNPSNENRPESKRSKPGSLRDQLLNDMSGGECLSLSHIDSFVSYNYATETLSTRQSRVMVAVASLLTEGLAVVGEIVGASDEHIDPWKLSTEDALTRLQVLYVTQYDDWDSGDGLCGLRSPLMVSEPPRKCRSRVLSVG